MFSSVNGCRKNNHFTKVRPLGRMLWPVNIIKHINVCSLPVVERLGLHEGMGGKFGLITTSQKCQSRLILVHVTLPATGRRIPLNDKLLMEC